MSIDKLHWLIGTWNRVNIKQGRTGTETWTKSADGKLLGLGVTMKAADTVFTEKLELLKKGSHLFYVAHVAENNAPTYFKLTQVNPNSFVCEAPEHDYPKKIAYTFARDTLKVVISGDGKSNDFIFVRKK